LRLSVAAVVVIVAVQVVVAAQLIQKRFLVMGFSL